jgi:SAM-dependent methyltransferase
MGRGIGTDDAGSRFGFGRNWQRYLDRSFSPDRLEIARRHLLRFLGQETLAGLRVLDIGSGSGINSLAALEAGAAEVVSFDFDANAVAATRRLHETKGRPAAWSVRQGSILDEAFCAGLGRFDLVYAWGVLHHTGDQWRALTNAAGLMAPGGRLYVALYAREAFIDPSPEQWLEIKQRYNRATAFGRGLMEAGHVWRVLLEGRWSRLPQLPALILGYRQNRGMALMTDVRDWLGGWPMEFSTLREVTGHAGRQLGLELVTLATGEANSEYLFVARGTAAALGHTVIPEAELALFDLRALASLDPVPRDRPVFLFGTGRGAHLLKAEIARTPGLTLAGYLDIQRTEPLDGLPVHPVDGFVADYPPETPVILSNRHVLENARPLLARGFTAVYNGHPLVQRLARR